MPNYKIGIDVDTDTNDSAKKLGGVGGAATALGGVLGEGIGNIDAFGISLGDLLSPATLATGAITAIGGAMIATAAHAMNLASQVDSSTDLMQTQLALTDEEAVAFESTMRSIYENNYGTSFEDIAASLTTVEQGFERIGGIAPEELQTVTETALAMRDAFGMEVAETVGATATLMENFGLTSSEAMDFLVQAQQRGLDSSGDLLDTIGEYSVVFGEGGVSAGEFFSILEAGNAGGVLGTDKVADAFKEFSIRILDDSTGTKEALASIGISYETLRQGFTDKSISISDAQQMVIDKINEIEDPIERNRIGVALWGTQWEDSSGTAIASMGELEEAIGFTGDGLESLGDQYDNTATKIAEAQRKWDSSLVDVGDSLNELMSFILPGLALAMDLWVIPAIDRFSTWLDQLISGAKAVMDFFAWITPDGAPPAVPETSGVVSSSGSSSIPVAAPVMAAAGAGGGQIIQQFYIERGDPDVVREAAELGISNAQRSRGF